MAALSDEMFAVILSSSGWFSAEEARIAATVLRSALNSPGARGVSAGWFGIGSLYADMAISVVVRDRVGNRIRNRGFALRANKQLSDAEFTRYFRLSRQVFYDLLVKIEPLLAKDSTMASVSSGSPITAETMLAATLRFLAGGSYLDICFAFGIAIGTFYTDTGPIWRTMAAVHDHLSIAFPIDDNERLQEIADGFAKCSRGRLTGCVMAVDGLIVRTRQPTPEECGGNVIANRNRKGFWGTHLLAGCDSGARFTFVSQKCCGATHDWLAYQCTALAAAIEGDQLDKRFYIVADEAFVCGDQLLTPWGGRNLDPYKDSFNYHLSAMRQTIERAFGILTQRWGIFWRPLKCSMRRWSLVIVTCAKIHNLCIDEQIAFRGAHPDDRQSGDSVAVHLNSDVEGNAWDGRRRWDEHASRREQLTDDLAEQSIKRPRRA